MPFINLTKKKDQEEQKVVPAEAVTDVPVQEVVSTDVNIETPQQEVVPAVPVEVPEQVTPVDEQSNLNGEEHLKSKEVPTSLPGQEVDINEEGIKEIKGPPLPGSEEVQIPATPAEVPSPAETSVPTEMSVPVETVTEVPAVETVVEQSEPVSDIPAQTAISEEPAVPTVDNIVQDATLEPSPMNLAANLPKIEESAPEVSSTSVPAEEETLIQSIDPSTSKIDNYFDLVLSKNASDLHFAVGYPVFIRVDGSLERIGSSELSSEQAESLLYSVLTDDQKKSLSKEKEIDLSYEYKENARFRINMYYEKGNLAAAFRYLPTQIRTVEELKLPQIVHEFIEIPQGFVIVTGPTGSGKSTTIASMVHEINQKQKKHIITIEDPIEYVYPKAAALVDQREMKKDTLNWENALRAVLRQDPNIVVVGEMRDLETIASAITVAETGHLVFATLHTNNAVQTIDRIIDVFPPHQQSQIRSQLSNVISAVVSQRLVPVKSGGRRAVVEIMIGTSAVKNAIREGKTYQIDNIIQTSYDVGMITLERGLVELIREGELSIEDAQKYTTKPEELLRLMKKA